MGGKGGGGRVVVLNQYRGYRECRTPPSTLILQVSAAVRCA